MNPQEQATKPTTQRTQPETKNKKCIVIIIVLAILAVGGLIFGGVELWQSMRKDRELKKLDEELSLVKNEILDQAEDNWPEFKDYFAEAIFIYSWFTDNKTLLKYSEPDSEYQDYEILNLGGIRTIEDMKQRAYKIFDKDFIDDKFDKIVSEEFIKQGDGMVLVRDGVIGQTDVYDGYAFHKTMILDDGSYLYTVHFDDLSSDVGFYHGCKGGDYDFIYGLNLDGTFSFKEFATLAELCRR